MRYVMQFGELYRLTNRNYLKMLRDGTRGTLKPWEEYGAKRLAADVESVTDWGELEFVAALRLEKSEMGAGP